MKNGDIVTIKDRWGNYQVYRYHSDCNDDSIYVYLHFDMSTTHAVLEKKDEIVPNDELSKMLKNNKCY